MELVQRGTVDQFGDLNAGTAADHWQLGMLHLRRSIQLTFGCGPSKPADGADVTVSSDSSDVDEDGTSSKNGVFLPTQPWKEVWDLWILGFILYSAVMVPYRICFSSGAEGLMFIFEQLITLSFLIDVGFNFNTAFMQDERWITDRGSIAVRYLQGWFWIDFPSAIPVELIDLLLEGDSSSLGMLRFLRLFRLLRLLRLLKVGEYVAALEIRFDINLTFLRIVQMVLQLLFLAHMLGCFWFYMAALVGIDMEITTWVSSYDDGRGVDAPPDVQYLYAVYWALTTLTTVGYGDITPTNDVERVYSLFALLLGALVFGYMLSSIGSLVAAIDRQAALSEEKMDEVKEYMRWRKLPRDLVIRMRRYYTYYYSRKTAFDEEAILGGLTPALRFEVVKHSLKESIGKIPLFEKTLEPTFQLEVFPLFKPVSASMREVIFYKGDLPDGLFFLVKGSIEVISGYDGRVLYRVRQGQHFGETVLTGSRRPATHRAAAPCEMMVISSDELSELFKRRPVEGKLIKEAVLAEHVRKERMRSLSLRLLINKLGDGSPAQSLEGNIEDLTFENSKAHQQRAALQLQLAWSKRQDLLDLKTSNFDTNPAVAAEREKRNLKLTHKRASPSAMLDRDSSYRGARSSASISGSRAPPLLDQKLDRIDAIYTKLESLLDKLSRERSDRSGLRKA